MLIETPSSSDIATDWLSRAMHTPIHKSRERRPLQPRVLLPQTVFARVCWAAAAPMHGRKPFPLPAHLAPAGKLAMSESCLLLCPCEVRAPRETCHRDDSLQQPLSRTKSGRCTGQQKLASTAR